MATNFHSTILLAEDRVVFASKDAAIVDLEKRLKTLAEQHAPCDDLIASLRKQVEGLQSRLEALTVRS